MILMQKITSPMHSLSFLYLFFIFIYMYHIFFLKRDFETQDMHDHRTCLAKDRKSGAPRTNINHIRQINLL